MLQVPKYKWKYIKTKNKTLFNSIELFVLRDLLFFIELLVLFRFWCFYFFFCTYQSILDLLDVCEISLSYFYSVFFVFCFVYNHFIWIVLCRFLFSNILLVRWWYCLFLFYHVVALLWNAEQKNISFLSIFTFKEHQ